MLEKRIIIELLKCIEKIQFTEKKEGENIIGYIKHNDIVVQVSLLADNHGQYLELSYPIKTDCENIEKSIPYLQRWFVNGRYKICNDTIVVYSVVPFLDEKYLFKQIVHSLSEVADMRTVVNSPCK